MADPVKATFQRLNIRTRQPEGDPITVQFNPNQLTLGRSLQIETREGRRHSCGLPQVAGSKQNDLSLELTFDTTDRGISPDKAVDVTKDAQVGLSKLLDLVSVQPPTARSRTASPPPWVRFQWGKGLWYDGFVKNVEQRLVMFASNGIPVRATVTVTMEAFTPAEECQKEQRVGSGQTSRWVVQRGETLSRIAGAVYGDPAEWRRIADANRLANPRVIDPGQILMIPTMG
jgi:hypothetical protein